MKIIIAGINGFMGTALKPYLEEKGHIVVGFDNNIRINNVKSIRSQSVVPKKNIEYTKLDACNYQDLKNYIEKENPDTIIWLAEQPSASFSMIDQKHASETIRNNQQGTINVLYAIKEINPNIHLIKLGTEGEYPDWIWNEKHIPEGSRIKVKYKNKDWEIPMPRYFGSWYHFTKFSESYMLDYANRIWGLTITDVQQGIIYGNRNETRLDVDEFFGTLVHRFVAQAVEGLPLTIYGTGGQTRGMICIQNSLEALELLATNPPKKGEFRMIHQTGKEYSVLEVSNLIKKHIDCKIEKIKNPRVEMPSNNFTFETKTLTDLGLKTITLEEELPRLIKVVKQNKHRIIREILSPKEYTQWK